MMAKGAKASRVALSGYDGADDGHARRPSQVGHCAMNLDVHLVEGLLHP